MERHLDRPSRLWYQRSILCTAYGVLMSVLFPCSSDEMQCSQKEQRSVLRFSAVVSAHLVKVALAPDMTLGAGAFLSVR